jgi:hypothetical protein
MPGNLPLRGILRENPVGQSGARDGNNLLIGRLMHKQAEFRPPPPANVSDRAGDGARAEALVFLPVIRAVETGLTRL